ncbi:MAG: ABC transporter permease [Muribaculaceae bacterium]|nr:ABC transporter permease [Muribaculaceae bacterium]
MNYPFFLARRLSLASGSRKNAPAVTVAIISIALSVAVMLASIAIVLGFKKEIREKLIGFNGHITLMVVALNEEDDNILRLDDELKNALNEIPIITDYALQAVIPAILKTNSDFKGIYIKELNGNSNLNFISRNLEEGEIPDYNIESNNNKIIISRIAADQLNLKTGDKIDTYFITDDIRVRKLEISGVYNSHFDQYDDILIYGSPALVTKLGNIDLNEGTYLQIYTDDFDKIEEYSLLILNELNKKYVEGKLSKVYRTDTVLSQGRSFFNWLSLLDTNVIVIITLMLIVGGITLISGMLIVILERKKFIGLMRALGSGISKIREVFVFMAIRIALIGLIIGNVLMITFLYLQEKFHFLPLDADSYYIDFVPVYLPFYSIIALNAGVLLVIYLVLVLPSRFVAQISPSETMRYE